LIITTPCGAKLINQGCVDRIQRVWAVKRDQANPFDVINYEDLRSSAEACYS